MPDESRPPDLGQHRLGPHVVGRRVVVRRLLRGEVGPSGGPAMTDLLGVCVAWGEGRCVVQPESGEAVTIPLADIVSGKPVPPRPSVRQRVSARDAELHTAALWASVETAPLGEWVLRTDSAPVGRLRRRANSCLAMGDPEAPVAEALATVQDFYAARDRPVLVQVEAGAEVEDAVREAGWVEADPSGEAELRLAALSGVRRALGRVAEPDDLLVHESGPRVLVTVGDVAQGQAALDGDWLGLHGLQVAESHRRRGLARAVTAVLLEWGAERGALTAWLHVETDNPAGQAFWDGLGFAWHHTCRYYGPPSASRSAPASR
ncbi:MULTISPECIES: GNAT family N-acetyltransferase [Nocardioides]|uniref:GNAT family N-acetyltransferase n=1 Tax=Nocardioides vastitatis TaxID=2568655 RepID=A0ABW0ZFD2_9ACTN|nr:GNAT family N-acetyltransferase [Nocardioides sp.]THI93475.1 GNAT family N-acetyltransferase [Nocardioides sp.]